MTAVHRKSWEEFRDSRLLWWINRLLHTFGWAIVYQQDDSGAVTEVYPARVSFRGFSCEVEAEGFAGLAQYVADNADSMKKEAARNE